MTEITPPKRVLQIVSSMDRGGAETLLMNVYRNIDKSKVQFDFVSHVNKHCDYEDEIAMLGGRIFKIESLGKLGPIRYIRKLENIMNENKYQAIHAHTDFQGGFPILAARISGIRKRVSHSHSNHWSKQNNIISSAALQVLKTLIKITATNYCACSKDAGCFLFGKKMFNSGKVQILKNGIEVRKFTDSKLDSNETIREELNIPVGAKLIGHIGRFSESKNHSFILKILNKMLVEESNTFAILVGDGPLKVSIENEANKLGISNNIRFLGVRADIPRLMNAFDVFLFPSLNEGFGIVALEAQCAGTPCVVSDSIPKTTDMGLNLVSYINLKEDLSVWSREINKALFKERPESEKILSNFSKNGYSIYNNVNDWLSLYGLT